ncbi:MAG: recombinase RecA [Methanosarcinales archaeon]|nr:recombinase RecA [Methanosarcinales archaeon]
MSDADTANIVGETTFAPQSTYIPSLKPTGIYTLDRNLGGGLPAGSMVYFSADAHSMAEVFLYQFTQARKTYYITTQRRPKYILRDIESYNFDTSRITFIDAYNQYYLTPHGDMVDNVGNEYVDTQILEFIEFNLQTILDESMDQDINIIIDTFSFFIELNVNPGQIKKLLNIIYETTKETDALTFIYAMKDTHDKAKENDLMNSCDVVFDVDLEKGADKIASKLSIPKIRGKVGSPDVVKFKIGEGIMIDTSQDIA